MVQLEACWISGQSVATKRMKWDLWKGFQHPILFEYAMDRILPASDSDVSFFGDNLFVDLGRAAGTVLSIDNGHLLIGYYSPLSQLFWRECAVRIYLIMLAHTGDWEELIKCEENYGSDEEP